MKIIHIISRLLIRGGGAYRACAELAESQARLGHKVIIFHLLGETGETFIPEGVEVIACPNSIPFLGKKFGLSNLLKKELEFRIKDADIIHIHELWRYINVTASKLAKKYNKPYIVQPHGSLHPWKLRHKPVRKFLWGLFFEKKVISGANILYAESEEDLKDIVNYVPAAKVYVLPCGVYGDKFKEPTKYHSLEQFWPGCRDKKVILYLARIDVNKGLDLLIRAVSRLRDQLEGYHLLIAGPDYGRLTAKMKKLASELEVNNMLTWAGMISEDQKILAFQKSDFYVLPSLSENFGISVLEALFSMCPVITTSETAWTVLAEENAGIIVQSGVESLKEGVKRMINMTPADKKEMAERGYEFVEKRYDWSSVAALTIEAYQKIS